MSSDPVAQDITQPGLRNILRMETTQPQWATRVFRLVWEDGRKSVSGIVPGYFSEM